MSLHQFFPEWPKSSDWLQMNNEGREAQKLPIFRLHNTLKTEITILRSHYANSSIESPDCKQPPPAKQCTSASPWRTWRQLAGIPRVRKICPPYRSRSPEPQLFSARSYRFVHVMWEDYVSTKVCFNKRHLFRDASYQMGKAAWCVRWIVTPEWGMLVFWTDFGGRAGLHGDVSGLKGPFWF